MKDAGVRPRTEDRSAAILQAAFEVFTEEGFSAARMDTIAARAGITKGLIYFYFKNKQELFEAVFRECVKGPIYEALVRFNPAESMASHLAAFMAELYDKLFTTPFFLRMIRLILLEGQRIPELRAAYFRGVLAPMMDALRSSLDEGARRGEWSDKAVPEFLHVLIAPALIFGFWKDGFDQYMHLDSAAYCRDHQKLLLRSLGLGQQDMDAALAAAAKRSGGMFEVGAPGSPLAASSSSPQASPANRKAPGVRERGLFTARAARRRAKP